MSRKAMLLKIKSISDVITNSSTEVFLLKPTDGVRRCIEFLKQNHEKNGYEFVELPTEKDVELFIQNAAHKGKLWRYDFRYDPERFFYADDEYADWAKQGLTWDEIWLKIKDRYKDFVGAIVTEGSNEDVCDWDDEGVDYEVLRVLAEYYGDSHRLS